MENQVMRPGRVAAASILDLAAGAIPERLGEVFQVVMDNIQDPNTKATEKRSITITYTFAPDEDRQDIKMDIGVKSKLAPLKPVSSGLFVTPDMDGKLVAIEQLAVPPGQLMFDGTEQPMPVKLSLK